MGVLESPSPLTPLSTTGSVSGSMPKLAKEKEDVQTVTVAVDWKDEEIHYPDGGLRAWLVISGAMCCTCSTFGFANAWGVFQSYYETDILPTTSPSSIAWIGSMQVNYHVVNLVGHPKSLSFAVCFDIHSRNPDRTTMRPRLL
ncbi:hypothetical protein FA15DRAFT_234859 [Coprinopsis marcescibilis]|uniref:Uncharacterized protein n=1 Tax=Coprinopsis marcescibilis TaxID=230819 RepID=A0A5C3KFV2_COPMA|nr:hypothetical protein FA15DRAFT_234859 [Coprinopsis marcescibilis]